MNRTSYSKRPARSDYCRAVFNRYFFSLNSPVSDMMTTEIRVLHVCLQQAFLSCKAALATEGGNRDQSPAGMFATDISFHLRLHSKREEATEAGLFAADIFFTRTPIYNVATKISFSFVLFYCSLVHYVQESTLTLVMAKNA